MECLKVIQFLLARKPTKAGTIRTLIIALLLKRQHYKKAKRNIVAIGERKKPQRNGEPGYIRIDTVHQGDLDKCKRVYHINPMDEVTQYQIVCSERRFQSNI